MMIDDAELLQVKATIWAAAYAAWVTHYLRIGDDAAHAYACEMADEAVRAFCEGEDVA